MSAAVRARNAQSIMTQMQTTDMDYDEMKDYIETFIDEGTLERFARAICEVETAAGVRSIIQSLYRYMPKEETV